MKTLRQHPLIAITIALCISVLLPGCAPNNGKTVDPPRYNALQLASYSNTRGLIAISANSTNSTRFQQYEVTVNCDGHFRITSQFAEPTPLKQGRNVVDVRRSGNYVTGKLRDSGKSGSVQVGRYSYFVPKAGTLKVSAHDRMTLHENVLDRGKDTGFAYRLTIDCGRSAGLVAISAQDAWVTPSIVNCARRRKQDVTVRLNDDPTVRVIVYDPQLGAAIVRDDRRSCVQPPPEPAE